MDCRIFQEYQLKWESRSSVRTRPRKPIDFACVGNFFPIDKQVLFLLHEVDVLNDQARQDILLLSFCKYLNDIITLETDYIYNACYSIMHKNFPFAYSNLAKLNANTVIIDEYYHVYIARDLLLQIQTQFPHLPDLKINFSDAISAIEAIKESLSEEHRDVFEILAVCIFETTLVRELVTYFDSPNIHPTIKYYINDHMNDEAKHFGFFYEIFCYTWKNLPEDYRQSIGLQLGRFVTMYLNVESDIAFNTQLLSWILGDEQKAKVLVAGLYQGFKISSEIPIVKNVLNVLDKSGVLSHDIVRRGFVEAGLIKQEL